MNMDRGYRFQNTSESERYLIVIRRKGKVVGAKYFSWEHVGKGCMKKMELLLLAIDVVTGAGVHGMSPLPVPSPRSLSNPTEYPNVLIMDS
jgi:hypothetical protein